jgi:hypothetical protein
VPPQQRWIVSQFDRDVTRDRHNASDQFQREDIGASQKPELWERRAVEHLMK